jgi:hypothetical protein
MSGVKGRSGRKPKTVAIETARLELQNLMPYALKNIGMHVRKGLDPECKLSVWVVEMNVGRPKLQVQGQITETLNVKHIIELATREPERLTDGNTIEGEVRVLDGPPG